MCYHLNTLIRNIENIIPKVEITNYNVIINDKNFFGQSVKNLRNTCENIASTQGDGYIAVCLLDCTYVKEKHKS